MKETKIDSETMDLLRCNIEIRDPGHVVISGQLERAKYTRLNKVLEALGGEWSRKHKAHVFSQSASDLRAEFDKIVSKGTVATDGDYGWFPTPPPVVATMIDLIGGVGALEGKTVLEPSAGEGAIAIEARRCGANVTCVELHKARAAKLTELGFETYCGDFLTMQPRILGGLEHMTAIPRLFDVVLMNPPFAPDRADMQHVERAMKFLACGGTLCAVMSAGITFRADKRAVEFRKLLDAFEATYTKVDEGAFRESGTNVNTVIVKFTAR